METNDQIILKQILDQKHTAVAPALSFNEFFEVFSSEQILKDYNLSYDEIQAGIVDNGGDGGIDSIYLFANGDLIQEDTDLSALKKNVSLELILIQSKWTSGFTEAAVDKITAASEDLLNLSRDISGLASVYNSAVLQKMSLFQDAFKVLASRFPTLRISYNYATHATFVHPNVERKAARLKEKVSSLFSDVTVEFDFLTAQKLLLLARRMPTTVYELVLSENPISSNVAVGYACLVKLRDFNNFISDQHQQLRKVLFEANVRDYQGTTQVNEQIQKSLQERTGEDFWWLNNGVTILASKATQSGKILRLEDPQIVNGLQTSSEIYSYFKNCNTIGDERAILIRVIVPQVTESSDRIIKATNSQTSIPPASLRATDKIHRNIEEYLKPRGIYYDRRKNYYKNEGKRADQIVSIPAMAQAVMAILLQRPDAARARPSSLLKDDNDYQKIFSDIHPIDIYRICILLVRKSEAYVKSLTNITQDDRNNLRFYLAACLAVRLCGTTTPVAAKLVTIDLDLVTDADLSGSFAVVLQLYRELGGTDQVAKGQALLTKMLSVLSGEFSWLEK